MYAGAQTVDNIEVGMGATSMMYSDREAYTVQRVISQKRIIVTRDKVERVDANGASDDQEYAFIPVPLVESAPEWKCCNWFVAANGKQFCKRCNECAGCEGCEFFKKARKTNGITLVKCKNGWKQSGTESYFLVGVKDEFYDYSF
jgi:hypothetical protein